jgi:hypothetical protein
LPRPFTIFHFAVSNPDIPNPVAVMSYPDTAFTVEC